MPLLFAYDINRFSHDVAHFSSVLLTKNVKSFNIFCRGSEDLRRKM